MFFTIRIIFKTLRLLFKFFFSVLEAQGNYDYKDLLFIAIILAVIVALELIILILLICCCRKSQRHSYQRPWKRNKYKVRNNEPPGVIRKWAANSVTHKLLTDRSFEIPHNITAFCTRSFWSTVYFFSATALNFSSANKMFWKTRTQHKFNS